MIKNENAHDGDKNIKIRLVRYFQWRIYVGATRGRAPLVKKKKKKFNFFSFFAGKFCYRPYKKKKKNHNQFCLQKKCRIRIRRLDIYITI
jgi:hypothetical protein